MIVDAADVRDLGGGHYLVDGEVAVIVVERDLVQSEEMGRRQRGRLSVIGGRKLCGARESTEFEGVVRFHK